jgi:hypothetical protein
LRIEHARKHGPFDPRFPPIRHTPVPASLWRPGEERLGWQGFLARFFPNSTRHDFEVLAAYESYLNDVDASTGPGSTPSAVHVAQSDTTQRSDVEEAHAEAADTDRWEGEGGAPAGRPRRTRSGKRTVETQSV